MIGLYSPATARKGKGKKVKIGFTVFRIQSCKHIVHKDNCLYLGSEVKLGIPSVHLTLLVNSISFPLNFSVIERLPFRLRTSTSKWKMSSFALWNHSLAFMGYSQGLFVIELINAEIKSNVKSPGNSYFIFQLLLSVAPGKAYTYFFPWEPKSINCYSKYLAAGELRWTNLTQYQLVYYSKLSADWDYSASKKPNYGLFLSLSIIQFKKDDHHFGKSFSFTILK